jgi:hypothetical protein
MINPLNDIAPKPESQVAAPTVVVGATLEGIDNFVDESTFFDDALSAAPLSADTQNIVTPENEPPPVAPLPSEPPPQPEAQKPISESENIENIKRFIFLRDMIVSAGFALWLKDIGLMHLLMLTDAQKNNLIAVYKNYPELFKRVPKYADLILAEIMVLAGTYQTAVSIKKARNLAESIENTSDSENENNFFQKKNTDRKYFHVDDKGQYLFMPNSRVYVKKTERIKADIANDYNELVMANGKEAIKEIFGV